MEAVGQYGTVRRYECPGYRVDVKGDLAQVFRFLSVAGSVPKWTQVLDSPYHLPPLDLELMNPKSSLTAAIQIYELLKGRSDLREAIILGRSRNGKNE